MTARFLGDPGGPRRACDALHTDAPGRRVSADLIALSVFLIIEAARKVFMLPREQLVGAEQSLATDDDPADLRLPADRLAALPPIPSDDREDHQREQDRIDTTKVDRKTCRLAVFTRRGELYLLW